MKKTLKIVPKAGLHARPASKFVETVNDHDSSIKIREAGSEDDFVDAGSMLAVTGLGLKQGDEMEIKAEGEDAEETLEELEEIITTPEGE